MLQPFEPQRVAGEGPTGGWGAAEGHWAGPHCTGDAYKGLSSHRPSLQLSNSLPPTASARGATYREACSRFRLPPLKLSEWGGRGLGGCGVPSLLSLCCHIRVLPTLALTQGRQLGRNPAHSYKALATSLLAAINHICSLFEEKSPSNNYVCRFATLSPVSPQAWHSLGAQ